MFSLDTIASSFISQLGILVLLIMSWRAIVALARQSFGDMFQNLGLGMIAVVVIFMGPGLESFGKWLGEQMLP